ncbi:sigma-70 family RNA polymerase sigma factor [Paenibacillus sp. HJL G12]|uniref:Sigma-70 family RNA polymerase sigma factor n=1 Tax=Paenibacillus dendrobii TaxID=2691084 RepID=A0A7X3IEQ5_9BACL|nr:sigma-70 family RNA polymerase sigma factor [Paenibacillus dendrobii]MWV42490.1 sigma-70 family RNA polymerase sigma factor [Paenibacillus dendrobii]
MEMTELIERAKAGDAEAFVALMKHLERSMYGMAKSMLHRDEDVADALQESILKSYKSLPSLREPKFFKTWMFRIVINECNNILKQRSSTDMVAEVPPTVARVDEYNSVDLREIVDRLEEPQRMVVVLHYYEDIPLRQVAKLLNISESAAKMRLHRAREVLHHQLSNFQEGSLSYG